MSVMIKGMKMPGSCGKCKMQRFIGHSNYVCCGINDRIPKIADSFRDSKTDPDTRIKSIEAVKRPYWCPLVEIPTPHGRLIDADAVEKVLRNAIRIQQVGSQALGIEDDEDVKAEIRAYENILAAIKAEPTIIDAEG